MFISLSPSLNLSYVILGDPKRFPPVIFLHGIMGNKKNLGIFVERFLSAIPKYSAVIFDLRNHGLSSKHEEPFTVAACARDIKDACVKLGLSPQKIIGHSFGGKVALLCAKEWNIITEVWLLDSSPSAVLQKKALDRPHTLSALEIIEILSGIKFPLVSRRDLVDKLLARGVNNTIALWMTTNLVSRDDGVYLIFFPEEIKAMLLDFMSLDLWPTISLLDKTIAMHLVKAEYGERLSSRDEEKLKKHAPLHGHFHELKGAGHFLHADNPEGLIELMKSSF